MNLEEAQEQKSQINRIIEENFVESQSFSSSKNCFPGIGIHLTTNKDTFKTAIHLADESQKYLIEPVLKEVGKDNVDIQVTGIAYAYSSSDSSHPHSIEIGASISRSEANLQTGTLGCFVKKINNPSDLLILSCAHVLYDLMTGAGSKGDPIFFSALKNSGESIKHQIATLDSGDREFIEAIHKASSGEHNLFVDAALAKVTCSYSQDKINKIHNNCYLKGSRQLESLINTSVAKIGQKTGLTHGLIKEFEFKRIIHYGMNANDSIKQFGFNDLIAIEGSDNEPFSQPGDSGSLIYDRDGYALALIVGGTTRGGTNNKGFTYALPIDRVLDRLKIKLAFKGNVTDMPEQNPVDIANYQEQVKSMINTMMYLEKLPPGEAVAFGSGFEEAKQEAEEHLKKPPVKQLICEALTTTAEDVVEIGQNITPVLIGAILANTIVMPLNPIIYAWIAIIVSKIGIRAFCREYTTN